jgi:fatty acid-binding protein DegV
MLTQATHLSSELSFVWQTAKIMRSKAHNSKQKQFIGNPQEMTALEIRLELLVAKIQPHLQVGMSMEEITRNLEEEIFQVRLLLYAEKPDITINDVEESLSAYYHQ